VVYWYSWSCWWCENVCTYSTTTPLLSLSLNGHLNATRGLLLLTVVFSVLLTTGFCFSSILSYPWFSLGISQGFL
jgi:integral membrane sensor domain MASE1